MAIGPTIQEIMLAIRPFADEVENVSDLKDDNNLWESCAAMNWTAGDVRRLADVYRRANGQAA